jgi:hypothetical protein
MMIGDVQVFIAPAYVLAFFTASVYGLGFFLFLGRGWKQILLFWVAAVAGFFIGQEIAKAVGLRLFNIGAMNLVEGTVASALGLIAARTWGRAW